MSAPAPANPGGDDYVDKGVAAAQKKFGLGDPAKTRGVTEKITDKLRELFEKATGKKVPSKISN